MSGETSVAPRGLQAPVFDHNGTGTRSNRFSLWESALGSYLGSLYGQLGVVALLKPDLEQAPFYGLRARIKDATDDQGVRNRTNRDRWQKIQFTLDYLIQQSFSKTDKSILDAHNQEKLRERHTEEFRDLDRNKLSLSLKWLPHATILFHQVKSQYFEDDGTEALVKILWHESLKVKLHEVKKLNAFLTWNSKFADSWNQVNALVAKHSPSYLAGLQLLQVVKSHLNAEIQSFANLFMLRHRDAPFQIETLLDELKTQFRSVNADNMRARVSTPRIANVSLADSANEPQALVDGSSKKQCENFSKCGNYTSAERFNRCKDCHLAWKASQSTGLSTDTTKKVVQNMQKKFKKQMAKQKKEHRAALAAAMATQAPQAAASSEGNTEDELDFDTDSSDDTTKKSAAVTSVKPKKVVSLKAAAQKRASASVADASVRDGNALAAGVLDPESMPDQAHFVVSKAGKKRKTVEKTVEKPSKKKKKKDEPESL